MTDKPKTLEERLHTEEENSTALFTVLICLVNYLDEKGVLDTAELVDQILLQAQHRRALGSPLAAKLTIAKANALLGGVKAKPKGAPPPPPKSRR
jgi:hypothetical protein